MHITQTALRPGTKNHHFPSSTPAKPSCDAEGTHACTRSQHAVSRVTDDTRPEPTNNSKNSLSRSRHYISHANIAGLRGAVYLVDW